MPDLTFRNAATLIEQTLFNAVNRALRTRLAPVATITALRALTTRGASAGGYRRSDHELIYVTAAAVNFEWSTSSTAADDGVNTIQPTDAGAAGRWLRTTSTVQTGYLADVRLYEGEQTEAEILERLIGRVPSVAIRWENSAHEPQSQIPGSLYKYQVDFDIWVVSSNLRGGAQPEAVVGSSVPAEATADPGANAILGDVKQALAGKTGEELGQTGIAYCEIGNEAPVYRSLEERRFVFSVGVRVHATVSNPDTDTVTFTEVDEQLRLGDLHDQAALVAANYVSNGIRVTTLTGLVNAPISAGTAQIAGAAVTYAGGTRTFTANTWTYRDLLPNGTLVFLETPPFALAPAVTATALRVGRTIASATDIVDDVYIAATQFDFDPGDPDIIPTT